MSVAFTVQRETIMMNNNEFKIIKYLLVTVKLFIRHYCNRFIKNISITVLLKTKILMRKNFIRNKISEVVHMWLLYIYTQ